MTTPSAEFAAPAAYEPSSRVEIEATAPRPGSQAPEVRIVGGRYRLPDPCAVENGETSWQRVTNFAKTVEDNYHLGRWAERMVALGIGMRPDLYALAASTPPNDKRTLQDVAEDAKKIAGAGSGGNHGTAIHNFVQRQDQGERLIVPAPWDRAVAAYRACFARYGLQTLPGMIERHIVCKMLGVAGRFDSIVLWQGIPRVFDIKTSQSISYIWQATSIQEACYAHADGIWNPWTGTFDPMPAGLDLTTALVMEVPVDGSPARLHMVDIASGWAMATEHVAAVRAWRNRKDLSRLVPEPVVLPSTMPPPPVGVAAPAGAVFDVPAPVPTPLPTPTPVPLGVDAPAPTAVAPTPMPSAVTVVNLPKDPQALADGIVADMAAASRAAMGTSDARVELHTENPATQQDQQVAGVAVEERKPCPGDPSHYLDAHDAGGSWSGQPVSHGKRKCGRCEKYGHTVRTCKEDVPVKASATPAPQTEPTPSPMTCKHTSGWSARPVDGVYCCPDCGQPGKGQEPGTAEAPAAQDPWTVPVPQASTEALGTAAATMPSSTWPEGNGVPSAVVMPTLTERVTHSETIPALTALRNESITRGSWTLELEALAGQRHAYLNTPAAPLGTYAVQPSGASIVPPPTAPAVPFLAPLPAPESYVPGQMTIDDHSQLHHDALSTIEAEWMRQINATSSIRALAALRDKARAAGQWTDPLAVRAMERATSGELAPDLTTAVSQS